MDINVFKLCSGLRVLGYFMILLVVAIIAVSYYAVVFITWGPQLLRGDLHSLLAFSILFLFHFLLAMLTWCYFIVVFKDPGSVPENWRPVVEEENLEAGSSMTSAVHVAPEALTSTWSSDGLERKPIGYCIKCQNGKPPRCHHCSICKPNPIFNPLAFVAILATIAAVAQLDVNKLEQARQVKPIRDELEGLEELGGLGDSVSSSTLLASYCVSSPWALSFLMENTSRPGDAFAELRDAHHSRDYDLYLLVAVDL
uniref:Protein S-acyltransferase n=1 Tax=Fagus sylvatica TaxID=28930 RepID=A0A2N9FW94_FAGSY